ncbi:MAG: ATP-binding protein [Candidatus Krumholzibacteriia bacterium]
MWRRRLFWKLILTFSLVILFCLAVVGGYLVHSARRTSRTHLEDQLERLAYLVDERFASLLDAGRTAETDSLAELLGRGTGTRITAIAPDGTVLADTQSDPARMENHRFRPEVQEALRGRVGSSLRFSTTVRSRFLYVAIPSNARPGWVLRVAIPVEQYEQHVRASTNVLILGAALASVLAIVLGFFFTRRVTQPLEAMRTNLERLEAGEFGVRLDPGPEDEVGQLARTLNRVQEQLENTIQSLKSQHDQREFILSSMVEGLVAVDAEDRMLLVNSSARALLGLDALEVEGRALVETIRQPGFVDFARKVRISERPLGVELVLCDPQPRWLELHGAPVRFTEGGRAGAVIVFNDVTRLHKLEQARKDFVANVSHELKTPVTTIKGFLETLLEGGALDDPGSARRFLGIVSKHTERLSAIIDDLLYLSRLEYEEAEIARHPVDLAVVAEGCVADFEHVARSTGIELSIRVGAEPARILGDASLLTRALDNLIDNALEYGGVAEVRLVDEGGKVAILVADAGPGLPEAQLERVFDPFYRVDKSRSPGSGGAGLGLSVARTIVRGHGGDITLRNRPEGGLEARVTLPR